MCALTDHGFNQIAYIIFHALVQPIITEAFADAGATIFIAEINDDHIRDVEKCIPGAKVIRCDVRDRSAPARIADRIATECGKVDVFVNNVGHFVRLRPLAELADDDIDEILNYNLGQLIRMTKAMLPLLRAAAPGSSIINLTSIEAYRGIPNGAVYGAAKTGIMGFTKSLALELGPEGIRVNDIAPETTESAQVPLDIMISPKNRDHMDKWIPLGRFGKPSDCAGAALYLASPLSAWVTGSAIHVDGGALAAAGWMRTPSGEWVIMPMISGNGVGELMEAK